MEIDNRGLTDAKMVSNKKGKGTMDKILEETTVDIKESVQNGMSRCLFGAWPRRALLKSALPMKDWPLSFSACKENMSTDIKVF